MLPRRHQASCMGNTEAAMFSVVVPGRWPGWWQHENIEYCVYTGTKLLVHIHYMSSFRGTLTHMELALRGSGLPSPIGSGVDV